MNAKIGLEDAYISVTGKYSLHKESNGNGELICKYAAANNLYIMSTKFNHKKIHKGTWVGNTCNHINHVLVNQNKSSMIQDVRTLRRPNCDSDHYLVKTMITQKLIRTQKNSNTQRKQWNRKNLQNKEKLNQYRQSLYNKLESTEECQDINTEWQKIKDSVQNAAAEVIQNENKEPRKEWWDDECRKTVEEKTLARIKCINRRTSMNQNDHMQKGNLLMAFVKEKRRNG
jgi:DNA-binding FrmR family transcriptional regulator